MGLICKIFGHKPIRTSGDCWVASTAVGPCVAKLKKIKCSRCHKTLEHLPHEHLFR